MSIKDFNPWEKASNKFFQKMYPSSINCPYIPNIELVKIEIKEPPKLLKVKWSIDDIDLNDDNSVELNNSITDTIKELCTMQNNSVQPNKNNVIHTNTTNHQQIWIYPSNSTNGPTYTVAIDFAESYVIAQLQGIQYYFYASTSEKGARTWSTRKENAKEFLTQEEAELYAFDHFPMTVYKKCYFLKRM